MSIFKKFKEQKFKEQKLEEQKLEEENKKEPNSNKYKDAIRYIDGLGLCCYEGKYGYVNKDDKIIIPFEYRNEAAASVAKLKLQLSGEFQKIIESKNNTEDKSM